MSLSWGTGAARECGPGLFLKLITLYEGRVIWQGKRG
jgi:hypothetical protein